MFPSKLANGVEAETYEFGLVRHWGRRDILPTKFGPKKVKICKTRNGPATRDGTSTAFAEYESSPSTGNLKSSPSTSIPCGTRVESEYDISVLEY